VNSGDELSPFTIESEKLKMMNGGSDYHHSPSMVKSGDESLTFTVVYELRQLLSKVKNNVDEWW